MHPAPRSTPLSAMTAGPFLDLFFVLLFVLLFGLFGGQASAVETPPLPAAPPEAHCPADDETPGRDRHRQILDTAASQRPLPEIRSALRPFFAHWQDAYLDILQQLRDAGYSLKTVEDWAPGDDTRKTAFLHFDIHLRDLPAAFGVLDANLQRSAPADYCIHWRYGPQEQRREEQFLLLRRFNHETTRWALHADPLSTFLSREICPDPAQFKEWIASPGFKVVLGRILASDARYEQLVAELEELLVQLHATFRRQFPEGGMVNAHGSPLNRVLKTFPAPLYSRAMSLHSAEFLSSARMQRLGLGVSDYGFRKGRNLAYISDSACMTTDAPVFATRLQAAMDAGESLFILIHPFVLDSRPACYRLPGKNS